MAGSSTATFEAFDGHELHLLSGEVVRFSTITVAEAVRFLRMADAADDERFVEIDSFMEEWPQRIGIEKVRLVDLGFVIAWPEGEGEIELGDLTYQDAYAMVEVYATAISDAFAVESSRAKLRVLDEFPVTFGLEPAEPAEVFRFAQAFSRELYRLVYDLARDFSGHLTRGPRDQVTVVRASRSTPVSTT